MTMTLTPTMQSIVEQLAAKPIEGLSEDANTIWQAFLSHRRGALRLSPQGWEDLSSLLDWTTLCQLENAISSGTINDGHSGELLQRFLDELDMIGDDDA